ncbi:uncharacterized protein PGTG_03354 [Puccinia graminis f. sp. tritici CRL 75-36-700-3]|uniref:Uncharacterized protein n=1 Tax=Puccinia graminis f. sp. tritici (strain CRL 75-36-700-3 / race SCCL) TaxID=418459 RepID=E3JZC3_PUCGT|nr:uncharacterized protein PGTG_03354 [Puccinia graminis f. sp. tritici CRL 75-36-700-3]EFP77398.2 hypothetical protein PGTG_03354 [Puccinia graminis f. sp. tritici CRL 75-36-700-3]
MSQRDVEAEYPEGKVNLTLLRALSKAFRIRNGARYLQGLCVRGVESLSFGLPRKKRLYLRIPRTEVTLKSIRTYRHVALYKLTAESEGETSSRNTPLKTCLEGSVRFRAWWAGSVWNTY